MTFGYFNQNKPLEEMIFDAIKGIDYIKSGCNEIAMLSDESIDFEKYISIIKEEHGLEFYSNTIDLLTKLRDDLDSWFQGIELKAISQLSHTFGIYSNDDYERKNAIDLVLYTLILGSSYVQLFDAKIKGRDEADARENLINIYSALIPKELKEESTRNVIDALALGNPRSNLVGCISSNSQSKKYLRDVIALAHLFEHIYSKMYKLDQVNAKDL